MEEAIHRLLRTSPQGEDFPFSFHQVFLPAREPGKDEAGWRPYRLERERAGGETRVATITRGRSIARVCTLSRRLMAMERARALGRKPVNFLGWALKREARTWTEGKARQR